VFSGKNPCFSVIYICFSRKTRGFSALFLVFSVFSALNNYMRKDDHLIFEAIANATERDNRTLFLHYMIENLEKGLNFVENNAKIDSVKWNLIKSTIEKMDADLEKLVLAIRETTSKESSEDAQKPVGMCVKFVHWSVDRGGIGTPQSGVISVAKFDVPSVMNAFFTSVVKHEQEFGEKYVFDQTNYDYSINSDSIVIEDNDGVDRWVFIKA